VATSWSEIVGLGVNSLNRFILLHLPAAIDEAMANLHWIAQASDRD